MAERGYQPFVVIRPENEASQSLYKKLGFRKLYQTVRMTFMPSTWRGAENETSHVLRDNLENAVRQLTIEQNVVDDFRNVDGIVAAEEAAQDSANQVVDAETTVEEPEGNVEEFEDLREDVLLEPVEEESEDRIQVNELSVEGTVETRGDAEGSANDDGGNEGDGGTAGGDAE